MGLNKLKFLYKEIVLENASNSQNHGIIEHPDFQTTVYNPSCGDRINLYLNLNKNDEITAIKFDGSGCTISQASASLMTQAVKGKSKGKAVKLAKIFSDAATGKKQDPEDLAGLGDAKILTNVMAFPARIKCATLAWWALNRILLGRDGAQDNE